jgi:hypothetical protein
MESCGKHDEFYGKKVYEKNAIITFSISARSTITK